MSNIPVVDVHVTELMCYLSVFLSVMLQEHVGGEFISTDIWYRESKIMAGSGDKKDSKGGAAIVSGGGVDVVSGGGEKDAKDTVSGGATNIDGGGVDMINELESLS